MAGRPPSIDKVIDRRPVRDPATNDIVDYQEVTVADQIEGDLRIGLAPYRAAQRAGIHPDTFYAYQSDAARARSRVAAKGATAAKLTAYERKCIEFSNRVQAAELEWEVRTHTDLERLQRGGILVRTVTIKLDANGTEVERTTKDSHTLPDGKLAIERLKLRFPQRYRETHVIEGTGEGGAIPLELRVQSLVEAAERYASAQDGNGHEPRELGPGDDPDD